MSKTKEFFAIANDYLKRIKENEKQSIIDVAHIIADCISNDGLIQLFGIDHGHAFSMELGNRAGGLVNFHRWNVPDLVMRNEITEAELLKPDFNMDVTMAHKLLATYSIFDQDMFLLISSAANEPIIVEVALKAKEKNQKVVALVNKNHANVSPILHESGKKLTDIADYVLDDCAPYPDLVISLSDGTPFNQVSTICGNVIAQMITAEIYRYLMDKEVDCPILLSANVKGADEHNRAAVIKYWDRLNS